MDKASNILGQRFGRWTVLNRVANNSGGTAQWQCRCSCGTERIVRGTELRYGASTSCGCYMREIAKAICIERNTTHGMAHSKINRVWQGMIQRCHNPNNPSYPKYGGRGIYVCKRWRKSFKKFLSDMGLPKPNMTLDRINTYGPYKPSNCRWATYVQQSSNTRRNRFLTYRNQKLTMAEWSRRTGLRTMTIFKRLQRGWSIPETLTTPTGKQSSIWTNFST